MVPSGQAGAGSHVRGLQASGAAHVSSAHCDMGGGGASRVMLGTYSIGAGNEGIDTGVGATIGAGSATVCI